VAVAVQSDLMAGVGDHAAFFWERLERVAGNEPCGLDVVSLEHLQETADTDRSGEETLRDCQSVHVGRQRLAMLRLMCHRS
jgi:hypothetical protein